jgi:hypothetical protein
MFTPPPASAAITPWKIDIPQADLNDLKRRLRNARYPEKETVDDSSQGPQLGKFVTLMEYWRDQYDWRRAERMLNGFGQYRTEIDGLGIHFIHVRSRHENALPMILTQGWPGSIVEFHKVIGPLVDPTAFGGDANDAFHVVIPFLPGFGFSDKPMAPGWNVDRIARAWASRSRRIARRGRQARECDRSRWPTSPSTARGLHGQHARHARRCRDDGRCPRPLPGGAPPLSRSGPRLP